MPATPFNPAIPDSADAQTRVLWRSVLDRVNFLVGQVESLSSRPAPDIRGINQQIQGLTVSLAAVKDNLLQQQTLVSFGNATPIEGNPGTVTSVSGTGTVNGLTLTGTVTSSGFLTLGGTLSGINLATQVTGVLPAGSGGTGLSSPGAAGSVLTSDGTNWVASPAGAGEITRAYTWFLS